jgi:single-stranded DNA-binding protein
MNLQGQIKQIGKTQTFGSNGFKKREVIIVTDLNTDYPQTISVEFHQANCERVEKYKKGEEVIIDINIRGREWTNPQGQTRIYNSIVGWRISEPEGNQPIEKLKEVFDVKETEPIETDDLPF